MECIKQAVIFMILARVLQIILGNRENEKYIRGFAGLLSICIMFSGVNNTIDIDKMSSQMEKNLMDMEESNQKFAANFLYDFTVDENEKVTKEYDTQISLPQIQIKDNIEKIRIPPIAIGSIVKK